MKITRTLLLSLLAPGVICLLVAVQIAFGLRGFDAPRGGVAAILEVPGLLVGWGSLLLLGPLLVWLVLDWWGVSFSGIALKCLGATAVAIAVGAMCGIAGGVGSGGHLGASLGALLHQSLGGTVAFALLLLMVLPGLVLTCVGFLKQAESGAGKAGPARSSDLSRHVDVEVASTDPTDAAPVFVESDVRSVAPSDVAPPPVPAGPETPPATAARPKREPEEPKKRARLFRRRKRVSNLADLVRDSAKRPRIAGEPWYPPSQYDAHGNELPMDFGEHRDVGGIRFAAGDEAEAPSTAGTTDAPGELDAAAPANLADEATPEGVIEDALPTIPELFAGAYDKHALEDALEGDDAASEAEPRAVETREADASASDALEADALEAGTFKASVPEQIASDDRMIEGIGRLVGSAEAVEETLMPGVRWAPSESETERSRLDRESEERHAAETRVHRRLVSEVGRVPAALDDDHTDETLDADVSDDEVALGKLMSQTPSPASRGSDEEAPSVRDSVLQALEGQSHNQSSQRYMEKLEASGIFDFMDDAPPQEAPAARSNKSAAGKKRAPKKKVTAKQAKASKKKTARTKSTPKKKAQAKKATKKRVAKKPPKKKATRKAKKTKRPKASTTKKPNAVRRPRQEPSVKRKPETKSAPRAPQTETMAPPAEKRERSGPREQWRTGSWRHGPGGIQAASATPARETVTEELRRLVIRERRDPQFTRAAELSLDRGAASPVLLTRRLGVSFAVAKSLVARLEAVGVLGQMTPTGSHPTVMTREIWIEASR